MKGRMKVDTRIFIMTHKEFEPPQQACYVPLHVGKNGKKELNYPGDDTGDEISDKNDTFCELTGLYWIWKNVSCDMAGLVITAGISCGGDRRRRRGRWGRRSWIRIISNSA